MLRRQIGRGSNRQRIAALVGIVIARDNLHITLFRPALTLRHHSNLAHSKTMHNGNRQSSHTRLIFHIEYRTIHIHTIGIGAIEYDDLARKISTSVNHAYHTDIICIETQSNILHINEQNIERLHLIIRGAQHIAIVKRPDGYSRLLVHRTGYMLTSIGRATKTVLRRKDANQIYALADEHIHKMLLASHCCVVCQYGYALTLKQWQILCRTLGANGNSCGSGLCTTAREAEQREYG